MRQIHLRTIKILQHELFLIFFFSVLSHRNLPSIPTEPEVKFRLFLIDPFRRLCVFLLLAESRHRLWMCIVPLIYGRCDAAASSNSTHLDVNLAALAAPLMF